VAGRLFGGEVVEFGAVGFTAKRRSSSGRSPAAIGDTAWWNKRIDVSIVYEFFLRLRFERGARSELNSLLTMSIISLEL
jgi:hypothetical protein